jgi:hypothetical protein
MGLKITVMGDSLEEIISEMEQMVETFKTPYLSEDKSDPVQEKEEHVPLEQETKTEKPAGKKKERSAREEAIDIAHELYDSPDKASQDYVHHMLEVLKVKTFAEITEDQEERFLELAREAKAKLAA